MIGAGILKGPSVMRFSVRYADCAVRVRAPVPFCSFVQTSAVGVHSVRVDNSSTGHSSPGTAILNQKIDPVTGGRCAEASA